MRRQFLLASVGAIALAGSAFAAPPPAYLPPVPIFSWTGLYFGGQIGYAWDHDSQQVTAFVPAIPPVIVDGEIVVPGVPATFLTDSFSSSPQGVIGGAHIGYNLQINQWVAGLEGTVDGTSVSKTVFDPFSGINVSTKAPIQGSIRARAGVAWDRALIYVTGGGAFTNITNNYSLFGVGIPSESISKTRSGWTVGAGIDYAVTNNWSVRVEYRYSDFGHYTDTPFVALVVPPLGASLAVQHHLTQNQVQVGFSYKFDSFPVY
jgi:outer membrane immunogenic protein